MLIEPNIEGYAIFPTMSLGVLKGYLNKKTNHEADIVDLAFHKKDWKQSLLNRIKKYNPALIGMSVLSFNYTQALTIAKFIKDNFDIKIIFGGIHCILSPEEVIKNKEVDMVCIGEGEETLEKLMDNSLNCKNIQGIWYKKDGEIIKNPQKKLVEDLDGRAFPEWDSFDLKKYFLINDNHLPIMASRGCPYNCTYCSNHALKKKLNGKYVRFRSVENIMEEIELNIKLYYKEGFRFLFFYDDTFILDRKFILKFCEEYKKRGFDKKIKWEVNVRADLVTEEIIKAMRDAGCYEVRMGYEAGNDYIRNEIYKRNLTKEQLSNAIDIIKRNGLQLRLTFILGSPYDTIETMEESFAMAKKHDAEYTLFPILVPLPETDIRKMCVKENLIEKDSFENFSDMFCKPVVRTKYISRKELQKFVNKIRKYQIKKYFLKGWKMKHLRFILDLLIFLYYKQLYKLTIDHVWRFTINKYNLEKISKELEKENVADKGIINPNSS